MKKYFLMMFVLCSCSALTVTGQPPPKSCQNRAAGMCPSNYQNIPAQKICEIENGQCQCRCESR